MSTKMILGNLKSLYIQDFDRLLGDMMRSNDMFPSVTTLSIHSNVFKEKYLKKFPNVEILHIYTEWSKSINLPDIPHLTQLHTNTNIMVSDKIWPNVTLIAIPSPIPSGFPALTHITVRRIDDIPDTNTDLENIVVIAPRIYDDDVIVDVRRFKKLKNLKITFYSFPMSMDIYINIIVYINNTSVVEVPSGISPSIFRE